nr:MAG TPA_asm: hypothetical protein [Bacteriophage sp.]
MTTITRTRKVEKSVAASHGFFDFISPKIS